MSARRRVLALAVVLLTGLASCAASAGPQTSTGRTHGTAAVATDQACTRHASAQEVLASVPYRTDDLAAMTVPRSGLPKAVGSYQVDWYQYGYMDNAEAPQFAFAVPGLCAINRVSGRITGFSRGFIASDQALATATDLFFGARGAHRWLTAYVEAVTSQAGSSEFTKVSATSLAGPGSDAVRLSFTGRDHSHRTTLLFRQGQIVGEVIDAWAPSTQPALDIRATARRLDDRIRAWTRTANGRESTPVDAVIALSAGLPLAQLGDRYHRMVWDWYFGGCWDPQEAASQVGSRTERRHYLTDAKRFGQLTFCRAMYVPPDDQEAVGGVTRVFTGGTLFLTAAGARDSIGETVRDWKARAGETRGGTSYGPLVRFAPGDVGRNAVGLQQQAGDLTYVRVLFRIGAYVAVAALVAGPVKGMRADVRRWAGSLDRRLEHLFTTRAA